MTPSFILDVGVLVDTTKADELKWSREDVASTNIISPACYIFECPSHTRGAKCKHYWLTRFFTFDIYVAVARNLPRFWRRLRY